MRTQSEWEWQKAQRDAELMKEVLSQAVRPTIVFAMYLAALTIFGAALYKALFIALALMILHAAGMGRARLERAAIFVFVLGALVWVDAIPNPSDMKHATEKFLQSQFARSTMLQ